MVRYTVDHSASSLLASREIPLVAARACLVGTVEVGPLVEVGLGTFVDKPSTAAVAHAVVHVDNGAAEVGFVRCFLLPFDDVSFAVELQRHQQLQGLVLGLPRMERQPVVAEEVAHALACAEVGCTEIAMKLGVPRSAADAVVAFGRNIAGDSSAHFDVVELRRHGGNTVPDLDPQDGRACLEEEEAFRRLKGQDALASDRHRFLHIPSDPTSEWWLPYSRPSPGKSDFHQ